MAAGLLYGWELGAGSSHLELARGLLAALPPAFGRVSLALRNLAAAHRRFPPECVRLHQAPVAGFAGVLANPSTYAELLFESGFHDVDALLARLRAWDTVLDAAAPDVIVADHAPTLLLAARGRAARRCCVGAGFFCPPRGSPMPGFRSWDCIPTGRCAAIEARVLDNINRALDARRQPALGCVADLFDLDETFLTTEPELDHYGTRAGQRYWGFYASADGGGLKTPWPPGEGPREIGYLSRDCPRIVELLQVLVRLRWPAVVHIQGLSVEQRRQLDAPSLVLTDQWLDMADAMIGAALVLCHAGAGTMGCALEQGRTLVTLPLQAEQTVAALRLKASGLGHTLLSAEPALLRRVLRDAAQDEPLQRRLAVFQSRIGRASDNLGAIGCRLVELIR